MRKLALPGAAALTMVCLMAAVAGVTPTTTPAAFANNVYQTLPFLQNWTDTNLITTDNDWSGVPGIIGYDGRDDGNTTAGIDPRSVLADTTLTSNVSVSANRHNPNTITDKAVAEFHPGGELDFSVVAIRASTEFDAPFLLLHLNTTGRTGITVAYDLIDLDGSGRDAVTPVALHYRVGSSGNFTNVEAGYVADATQGPDLKGLVTPVSAPLPAAADNQAQLQVRILTTNAVGADEWVGISNIRVTSATGGPPLNNRLFLPLIRR
jgi:uncharacterized protein